MYKSHDTKSLPEYMCQRACVVGLWAMRFAAGVDLGVMDIYIYIYI